MWSFAPEWICEISASGWFYYKENIPNCQHLMYAFFQSI